MCLFHIVTSNCGRTSAKRHAPQGVLSLISTPQFVLMPHVYTKVLEMSFKTQSSTDCLQGSHPSTAVAWYSHSGECNDAK